MKLLLTLTTVVVAFLSPAPAHAQPASSDSVSPVESAAIPSQCEAQCVRANADRAANACAIRIEDEAPGDYDWLQRPVGGLFKEADTAKPDAPTIARYRGDSIRFLSPQREWIRAIYECGFDTAKQQVSYIRINFGVLGKKSAVPVLPAPRQQARVPQQQSGQQNSAQASTASLGGASAPTSDRRRVGEVDDVSVLQVRPSSKQR